MKNLAAVAVIVSLPNLVAGQGAGEGTAFAVASVRRNPTIPRQLVTSIEDAARVAYPNITLRWLLMSAYDVRGYQVIGPRWLDTEYYDVEAAMPEGASKEQIPAMLRALLAERFQLRAHRESREVPIYAIRIGSGALKLQGSDATAESAVAAPSPDGTVHIRASTLASLARALSGLMGRPVIDETGIEGAFFISLVAPWDDLPGLRGVSPPPRPAVLGPPQATPAPGELLPTVSDSLRVMGLRLESRRAEIDQVIADAAERVPTEN